jgi:hypothetical protein
MDDLIAAVDRIADTSFDASKVDAPNTRTFGANLIASRRSGSVKEGFYRPGERGKSYGPPFFEPSTEPLPNYFRVHCTPNDDDKRGAWQLQEEYLAVRLGKNAEENSRLWNTAIWVDRLVRIATMPVQAMKSLNLYVDNKQDVFSADYEDDEAFPDEKNEGFEFTRVKIYEEKELRALNLSDYDLVRLADEFNESDKLAAIDVNKLARGANPLPEQADLPSPIVRVESGKIIRMLMLGMRSLWHPVIRAIADHATMKSLGTTQGVGDGVAATVGRQRVIEGLRIAESIRKGIGRQDRAFSMRLNGRADQEVVSSTEWRLSNRYKLGSVDEIIGQVLAALGGPPSQPAENLLAANDNWPVEFAASKAA